MSSNQRNVPKMKTNMSKKSKPIWMTYKAQKAVKAKYNSWKKYTRSKQHYDFEDFKRKRNQATREVRRARMMFERKLARNLKTDVKTFWRYVNNGMKVRVPVGDLEREDGTVATTDTEKAEVLNQFFTSVFTIEDMENLPTMEERHGGNILPELEITMHEVMDKLTKLKVDKSPGPDGMHPHVLHRLRKVLVTPLTKLFQLSAASGTLPEQWKTAHVSALHKKQSRKSPSNYRPVSLTCVVCKIMESIIRDKIMTHMTDNAMFSKAQHGFRPGRSCVTQLLEVIESWTRILDAGGVVDAIYFDFAKAFDTVPRERLLLKCYAHGIQGSTLTWIRSFLTGRSQRVVVNGADSSWSQVTSGIPQGSVLGPLLFLLFINDMPDDIMSSIKIFADDTKVYKDVQTEEDMLTLQKDVYALCDWSLKWQLTFNASKCTHMTYGNAKVKSKYKMKEGDGKVTDIKHDDEVEKDLGVLFDTKLSFRQHIGCTVKKVNRMIGLTRRTFHYMDQEVFRLLFTSLMRPHMDYADCIWSPHLKVDIAQLENAQRRATRLVPDLRDRCYEDRLRALNLPSLLYRRRRMDMIQTFRIMTGIDDLEASDFFTMNSRETRGHGMKIMKQPSRLNLRKFSFSHRVVDDWNSLPSKVVEARDVEQFKAELDEAWKDIRFLHTAL